MPDQLAQPDHIAIKASRPALGRSLNGQDVVLIENDLPDLYERPLL